MKKLKIFGIVICSFIIILFIGGYAFYQFYLKPLKNIKPAVNHLVENTFYDKAMVDTIFKYTHANIRNTACISIAIIDNDLVSYYGLERKNDSLKTIETRDSLFQIGSISKVFTSTILANLILNKQIDPEESIDKYLGFKLKGDIKLRIKDLANHTSGLPKMPDGVYTNMMEDYNQPYKNYTESWLVNYLKNEIEINEKQKDKSEYSNLGAAILGYVLAHSQKTSYDKLLKQSVFEKYGLKYSFLYQKTYENLIVKSRNMADSLTVNWTLNAFNPAGGVVSNIQDMSKFALAQLDTSNKELILTQIPTNRIDSSMQMGLGWFIIKSKLNHNVLFHNGATSNFNSSMMIDLDSKKAIIILSNANYSDTKGSLDKLSKAVLSYLNTKR